MKTNSELQKDVIDELKWEPQLQAVSTQIGVSAKDGVVTLSGLVDTYSKKRAAERAAQRVKGVKVLASDIEVNLGHFGKKTDTEIASAVRNALRWNSAVNDDKVEIKVDNGGVTLEGEVDWIYQKNFAQNNVEHLVGVKGIINNIKVRTTSIDVNDIKRKISAAFHRDATIDASDIRMEAAGNKVLLRGHVRSYAEKKEAERIAWSSPGVLHVENEILIDTDVFV